MKTSKKMKIAATRTNQKAKIIHGRTNENEIYVMQSR